MRNSYKQLVTIGLAASFLISTASVDARGGGGRGGGFGGGGFGGGARSAGFDGGGGRESTGRADGWGNRGWGDDDHGWGNFDRGFDSGPFYPDGGASLRNDARTNAQPQVSESDLKAAADHEYSTFAADKGYGMASDGGFARSASVAPRISNASGLANRAVNAASRTGDYATNKISPADLASRAQDVRSSFNYYNAFDRNWWGAHTGSWYYPGWRDDWAWYGVGWGDLSGYWGVSNEPVEYDYGNNITYQNDEVYYGSQPTATATTYYAQAQTLADSTPAANATSEPESDWKPLGVYSLTQGSQSNSTILFQLAVNKSGAIRGNYYNALTQDTKPVRGAVDKKDMRASWVVGSNNSVVYDTGLANLLKSQSTVLVHLSKTQTQQWNLVKLNMPSKKS